MREIVAEFIADLTVRGRRPGTLVTRSEQLNRAVGYLIGQGCMRVADVRAEDLDRYLCSMQEEGLSRWTIRGARGALWGLFGWLHERGKVLIDPAADLELTRGDDEELPPAPLSEEDVSALFDRIPRRHAVDLRNRAHVEMLYGCGMRLDESLAMPLDAIDRDRRTVLVRGKFGHERLLPIMPGTMAALDDYLSLRRSLLQGPDRGILFLGVSGGRVVAVSFQQWLRRIGRRVLGKERRVYPHLLRHSIAVHLLRRGADIRYVQEFLGHADLDTTKTYLRLVPGHLREDYDKAMPALAAGCP